MRESAQKDVIGISRAYESLVLSSSLCVCACSLPVALRRSPKHHRKSVRNLRMIDILQKRGMAITSLGEKGAGGYSQPMPRPQSKG